MAGQFQFLEGCYSSTTTPAEQAMDGPIRLHEEKKDLQEWTVEKHRSIVSLGISQIYDAKQNIKVNAAKYEPCTMFETQWNTSNVYRHSPMTWLCANLPSWNQRPFHISGGFLATANNAIRSVPTPAKWTMLPFNSNSYSVGLRGQTTKNKWSKTSKTLTKQSNEETSQGWNLDDRMCGAGWGLVGLSRVGTLSSTRSIIEAEGRMVCPAQ